jgi:hypothetical protein
MAAISSTNKIFKVGCILLALMPVLIFGGTLFHWWQFDHLEDRAKRIVTATELQAWATSVLAEFPTYSPQQAHQLRTNFPAKLRPLCKGFGFACWVSVVSFKEEPAVSRDYPDFVNIIWSMKPSGDAAFEIGPTNFASGHSGAHMWAPGVYFYRR